MLRTQLRISKLAGAVPGTTLDRRIMCGRKSLLILLGACLHALSLALHARASLVVNESLVSLLLVLLCWQETLVADLMQLRPLSE